MKKIKLLKQSKKFVAVVTAVALLDAPVAYAADTSVPETAQYQAEEVVDSTDEISSEQPESESEVQQTGESEEAVESETEQSSEPETSETEKTTEVQEESVADIEKETLEAVTETAEIVQSAPESGNGWGDDGYYYQNGEIVKDREVTYWDEENERYRYTRFDENGIQYKNSWYQDGDNWYYYGEEGDRAEGLVDIAGNTYFFDSSGIMLRASTFSITDQETGKEINYRSDENGHVVKGWYHDSWNSWYYDPVTGIMATGVVTIDDKTYCFDTYMRVNYAYTQDGILYYFGEDGVLEEKQEITQDGWTSFRGNEYYIRDGELVKGQFITEGDDTYFVAWDGVLYKSTTFSVYDGEKDTYGNYRADENGRLVKGWYQPEGSDERYYYDESGNAANGITEVDGDTYYFELGGRMCTDYVFSEKGILYFFGSDGTLTDSQTIEEDGWIQNGDKRYYVQDGKLVTSKFITVDDSTYYMDGSGVMMKDQTFSVWDEEEGASHDYRADSNGHIIKGWYQPEESDEWYYYDANGKAGSGITEVNGNTYYFGYEGRMYTDYIVSENKTLYYFGSDGVCRNPQSIEQDGWIQLEDKWYYAKDGELVKSNFVTDNGNTYYMGYDGYMLTNDTFYAYNQDKGQEDWYRVDQDGHLVKGWYYESDSDAMGYNNWFYYNEDGSAVKGITEINGKTYYLNYEGEMLTNYVVTENGKIYHFDKNGVLSEENTLDKDDWVQFDGDWYYVKDGQLVQNEFLTVDGQTYYMNYNGVMETNTEFSIYDSDSDRTCYYRVDKDGHLVKGWFRYNESDTDWYYYDENGVKAEGLQNLNGTTYYFKNDYDGNGEMVANQAVVIDGTFYYFGSNGALEKKDNIEKDGWIGTSSCWYYVQNHDLVRKCAMKIDNALYVFDANGEMVVNDTCYAYPKGDTDGERYIYRTDSDGHAIKGWYENQNGWYYYDAEGRGVSGIQTINQSMYYFVDSEMQLNTKSVKDGKLYVFGGDGVGAEYTKDGWVGSRYMHNGGYYIKDGKLAEGWTKIDNKWYYFAKEDGESGMPGLKSLGQTKIDGSYYFFNSNGEMQTGLIKSSDKTRYADASGKLQESGWYQHTDGTWYYFKDAVAVTGLVKINGTYNMFQQDGTWSGALTASNNGWQKNGSDYYYLQNGVPITSTSKVVGGETYYFDEDGVMMRNCQYDGHYLQASGAMLVNGWLQDDAGVYSYYDANGVCVESGWKQINNQWYYFEQTNMNNQDRIIDGKLYRFASSGVSDGIGIDVAEGWNLIAGQYYYVKNNALVKNSIETIDGNSYCFDYEGRMLFNRIMEIDGKRYFFNANGMMEKNVWCYKDNSYAGSDGVLYTGEHVIEGQKYLFSDQGILIRGNRLSEDYKTVTVVDENGVIKNTVSANDDGWVRIANSWYYVKNGMFVRNRLLQINGKCYYFGMNGEMAVNEGIGDWSGFGQGYANADGVVITDGWVNNNQYVEDGTFIWSDPAIINGKYYLFVDRYSISGVGEEDGVYYYFDGNGNRTRQNMVQGWNKVHDEWYYMDDEGNLLKNTSKQIGNAFYCFDSSGKMVTNRLETVHSYTELHYAYYGADGTPVRNCWKTFEDETYYFDANGWAVTGVQHIDGKKYVFDNDGCLIQ